MTTWSEEYAALVKELGQLESDLETSTAAFAERRAEEIRRERERLDSVLEAARRGQRGLAVVLTQCRESAEKVGLADRFASEQRRSGGPPLTEPSDLEPFIQAAKAARDDLTVAVEAELAARSRPVASEPPTVVPDSPAPESVRSRHKSVWLVALLAVVTFVLIVVFLL